MNIRKRIIEVTVFSLLLVEFGGTQASHAQGKIFSSAPKPGPTPSPQPGPPPKPYTPPVPVKSIMKPAVIAPVAVPQPRPTPSAPQPSSQSGLKINGGAVLTKALEATTLVGTGVLLFTSTPEIITLGVIARISPTAITFVGSVVSLAGGTELEVAGFGTAILVTSVIASRIS